MTVLEARKYCLSRCGYDKGKMWSIDASYTEDDLQDFIELCKKDKFSRHIHKCELTYRIVPVSMRDTV